MGLNKVKPNSNMYQGWISHTWNPLAGKCPYACKYCSTNKLMFRPVIKKKYSGKHRLEEKEFKTNLGKGNFIFVCGQNDLFVNDVSDKDILRILEYCSQFDNKYLFQTKNPSRINENYLPEKSVVCTTIESNIQYTGNAPHPIYRAGGMTQIKNIPKYVTIEPILRFDLIQLVFLIKMCDVVQVNIGANTYKREGLPEPSKQEILDLIFELKKFTIVEVKSNLKRLLK